MLRSVTRTRAVAAALVLVIHVLLLLLLQVGGRTRPDAIHLRSTVAGITIRLSPVEPATLVRPDGSEVTPRLSAPVRAPAASAPTLLPERAAETPGSASAQPSPVDWSGKASAMAARVAQDTESPPTFGPPLQVMRKPCTPRTRYDQATREQMEPLMPEDNDPIPPGGIAAPSSSVKMGGVRVGIVRIGGGEQENPQRSSDGGGKSSFKWKWESPRMGNGGFEQLLTDGAEPVAYDGMFNDMQEGRTSRSSVPDPNICD